MQAPHVAIIGGGAAGMMAAATIAETCPGVRVTLLERNPRLGAKVIISGGGRCNVTTGVEDPRSVLAAYPRGARWLRHAMYRFPPRAVMDWFETRGVPLKIEDDLRVFPVSDNGRDIVGVFGRLFTRARVDVCPRAMVTAVERVDDGFRVRWREGEAHAAAVILTTGGHAFRHTGSTGDGYRFAAALGHTITPLYPSLNAHVVAESWAKRLSGLAVPDALLTIPSRHPGGRSYRFRGPFLFTHFGVSGPAVFALCSLAATEPYSPDQPLPLRVHLLPELREAELDATLRGRLDALGGRGIANVLDTLLPRSICPALCELAGIDPTLRAAQLGRDGRLRLVRLITALPLTIIGRKNGEEFVTAGGVATDEVDPRTMASRLVPGLYFAGELLDVDGFTGGYNLQAAWATGRLAGYSAAAYVSGGAAGT